MVSDRAPSAPDGWLDPVWSAPAGVSALCTSRIGGHSQGPYGSLNLGNHVGDAADAVARNRQVLRDATRAHPVFLEQVHGTAALQLTPSTPDGLVADVAWTEVPGLACTVMVADCLPILFCNAQGSRVAAAHAGWRGLLGAGGFGVVEQAVRCMAGDPADLRVWLGPCIGPSAFEVGDEVRAAFEAEQAGAHAYFVPAPAPVNAPARTVPPAGRGAEPSRKWLADLPGLARARLAALGVGQVEGNDGAQTWCTVSNPSRFFSHRRDRVSGRQAACVWLRPAGR